MQKKGLPVIAVALMFLLPLCTGTENYLKNLPGDPDYSVSVHDLLSTAPSKIKPSEIESELYRLIMEYRKSEGLPSIPYSRSLSKVARIHVRDLQKNRPSGKCNIHSWSDDGPWTPGCYTDDHAKANVMWDKPKELTGYKTSGFEIACTMSPSYINARQALDGWQDSYYHNQVIVNEGVWKGYTWKAIGIGLYGNYAVVWFGYSPDPVEK